MMRHKKFQYETPLLDPEPLQKSMIKTFAFTHLQTPKDPLIKL